MIVGGVVLVLVGVVVAVGLHVPADPHAMSDCAWVLDSGKRQDCRVDVAVHVFGDNAKAGEALLKAEFPDQLQRDMVYLKVTQEISPNDLRYCKLIEQPGFREQCESWVNRPHLRDGSPSGVRRPPGGPGGAAGGGAPGGPGGPPPAGGQPPPGSPTP